MVPSLYRKYGSRVRPGLENTAPGITARFEVFTDDTFPQMEVSYPIDRNLTLANWLQEHTCWIEFTPHE